MKKTTDFAYQAVYRYLVRLVNEAHDTSARRMPSLRQLARRLRVSISTVQNAYSLLEKEGRVRAVPKSGYYSVPADGLDLEQMLSSNVDPLLDALHRGARRPGMSLMGSDEPTVLQVQDNPLLAMERELTRQYPAPRDSGFQPFGDLELRTALAARYTCNAKEGWYADNVYIGPDLPGMLKAVIEILQLRGTCVLVESPCAWTLLRLLQSFDIKVIELSADEEGSVDLVLLDQMLKEKSVSMAFMSSALNPVRGSLRPLHNTHAIADLLNHYGVWVLENDSHGELLFTQGQSCLRDMIDPQRLLILGTFDKSLGPETPYGYLLCKAFQPQCQHYFLLRAFELPPIRQRAIARLCNSGRLDALLSDLRHSLASRMHTMTQQLDQHLSRTLRYEVPAGGCGIWAHSLHPMDMRQVFESLLAQRIVIAPGELFSLQGWHRHSLRISYAIDWAQNPEPMLVALDGACRQARLH
ncbi:PLP-dependent aminotransferase family protein [Pseudomonas sp. CDFA 602]|uniref:aminotransferase-like domain-containing protein n=1 Tax=Pseudomonas californiensis TaxID=2829823 RepID=UPI001E507364|nr:PLP-dependent aminotransferase family protein [Pseudomonas californiensis]MCD5996389.1 PLP-dependent aminotransferase family protein [Pseudomonas californiensis]MCD6001988.1 PLP-dependent aminotransferase family protein [Pseudomonas californiensis]